MHRIWQRPLSVFSVLIVMIITAVSAPTARADGFVPNPGLIWHDWFCVGQEVCDTGDFNGDGKEDVITFAGTSTNPNFAGNVFVSLSDGTRFASPSGTKWHDWFCVDQETCLTGDFNGDGKDDIVAFARTDNNPNFAGDVFVSLSDGTRFASPSGTKWHDWFCIAGEVCQVGDVNGDGKDDILAFTRDSRGNPARGNVWVALSTGSGFGPAQVWEDIFCLSTEICEVGDFNGDGKDDIVAFVRDSQSGAGQGDVWVALSSGHDFGSPSVWHRYFCLGQEICKVADVTGDRRADLVLFNRSSYQGSWEGDVRVAPSSLMSHDILLRPNPNGYSFPNYGGINQADLTIADLRRIFGDAAVCQNGTTNPCQPRPAAAQWLQQAHNIMSGGHCYGMAVTSLRFYKGNITPQSLQAGVNTVFGLPQSQPVRSHIAEYFTRQMTDPVQTARWQSLQESPTQILNRVIDAMQFGWNDPVVLDFWFWGGGHSVTPYAVQDVGGGRFWIWIYDNNFPNNTTRRIEINTQTNRWIYDWGGVPISGGTGTLEIVALSVNNAPPRCPWCASAGGTSGTNQIWASGGAALITDAQGRRLGSESGTAYRELPGGVWTPTLGGLGQPLPDLFSVPASGDLHVAVDGSGASAAAPVKVSLFGNDMAISVDGGMLQPNQRDGVRLAPDARSVVYKAAAAKTVSVTLGIAGQAPATAGGVHTATSAEAGFTITLHNAQIDAGQDLQISVDQATGKLRYQSGPAGGSYDLTVERTAPSGTAQFAHQRVQVQSGDTQYLNYGQWNGSGTIELTIDQGSDGTIDQVVQLDNRQEAASHPVYLPLLVR